VIITKEPSMPSTSTREQPVASTAQLGQALPPGAEAALLWQRITSRLAPLQKRWDVAVLGNLPDAGWTRPGAVLAAINAQAAPGRRITGEVLAETLRRLQDQGLIGRRVISATPRQTRIWLLGPGRRLIAALRLLDAWYLVSEADDEASGDTNGTGWAYGPVV
jgi:DNA-binding HxlR family transcriptional regulator